MAGDSGTILVSAEDTVENMLARSDELSSGRVQLGSVGTFFVRNAVALACAVSLAAAAALVLSFPRPSADLFALYVLCVAPQVVAICALGFVRWDVPFRILALISLIALLGAYALLVRSKFVGVEFSQVLTFGLMVTSLLPQFAGLWAATRAPHGDLGKPPLPIFQIGVVTVVTLTVVGLLSTVVEIHALSVEPAILSATFVAALLPSVFASWFQARRERKVPVKKGDKQPEHISGLGASALIIFSVIIVALGIWAAETGKTARIDKMTGTVVIFGLAFAFVAVAVAPFIPTSKAVGRLAHLLKLAARPLGIVFSWLDSILVFPIAGALGATQSNLLRRYTLLLGYLIPSAFLGWWLKAPYGLIPLFLSVIGAIAIARRWSWVEEDRENAMLNRQFEGSHIRVGFEQDLRDETLVAFMALLFLVPLILRQLHLCLGGHVFDATPEAANDIFAWLSFFGTELAKALPFVDWAEVYHVEGAAAIQVNESGVGAAQHIIFATRILVDLVLLAAFLQAISIAQRTRKLRDMFYIDRSIDRLDPFVEAKELRALARNGPDGLELIEDRVRDFPRYDTDRLESLKQRRDDVGFVASKLLDRYAAGGPEEQLRREIEGGKPNRKVCEELIDQLNSGQQFAVGPLKAAHFALNSTSAYNQMRLAITDLIATRVDDKVAINALSEILIGPGPGVADVRREVRLRALSALYRPAIEGNLVAQKSIERAATSDGAFVVKEQALTMLKDWAKNTPSDQPLIPTSQNLKRDEEPTLPLH